MVNPETYSVEYVHTDALGSPVAYTGSNGSVLPGRSMRYEPYGTPTMATREGEPSYTGHQYDASTGLIYAQQRYYDPMLGRFLGVDPMAVDTGSAFNWNRYAYANNSPYKFTDPDGRDSAIFYTRQYRMAPPDPQTAAATLGLIADFTPVVGDIKGFVDAYNDPSAANIVAAGIGLVPGFGDAAGKLIKNADEIADLAKGAANGDRAGKAHTRAANRLGRELNRNANGGELVCPTCQKTMNDPVQSTPGGGVDRDAAVGDHVIAKSKGGDGATVKDMRNHETKCWECNSKKSDN